MGPRVGGEGGDGGEEGELVVGEEGSGFDVSVIPRSF